MSQSVSNQAALGTSSSSRSSVSIEEITPVLKILPSKVIRQKAAKKHSTIITASPIKKNLIDRERKRQLKKLKEENLGRLKKKQILKKPGSSGKILTLNNCIIINISFYYFFFI